MWELLGTPRSRWVFYFNLQNLKYLKYTPILYHNIKRKRSEREKNRLICMIHQPLTIHSAASGGD